MPMIYSLSKYPYRDIVDFKRLLFWALEDVQMMRRALDLAKRGATCGEVPVGALVAVDGMVIAEGYNCPISTHDPTAHAEMVALRAACHTLNNYRLPPNSTLYVTLEPCTMCLGALIHARVGRVVYGACEPKSGALSVLHLMDLPFYNHQIKVQGGLLATECGAVLSRFFKHRRHEKRLQRTQLCADVCQN